MSVMDWSKFVEEQKPKKFSLEAKRRKRGAQDTQPKTMTIHSWRSLIVKPEREPRCDRCECVGEWHRPSKELQNSIQVFVMVRGAGMTVENAALICARCEPMFFAQRKSFKMRAHYFKWLAHHHKLLDIQAEIINKPRQKRVIEQVDDKELERLLEED